MKSKDLFYMWLLSQRDFSINYLKSNYSSLSHEDAEDIFSELLKKQLKLGDGHFELCERGVLIQRLNWTAHDFLDRRNAIRRGAGVEHQSTEELGHCLTAPDIDPVVSAVQADDLTLLLKLTKEVASHCNARQSIFVGLVSGVIKSGKAVNHWCDAFSTEEKAEFMGQSTGDADFDETKFRREVNRVCRQLIEKLRALYRTSDGHWLN